MKTLKKGELYRNLSTYLQAKGIELKDGSVTARIERGCSLLSDTINFAQTNLSKAKDKMDKKLDEMRQVIHQKTAPRSESSVVTPAPSPVPKKRMSPKKSKPAKASKSVPRQSKRDQKAK